MAQQTPETRSNAPQLIIIAVALAIVLGGLWTLIGGTGPYHPGDTVSQDDVQLLN